jgi:hypothetical protein
MNISEQIHDIQCYLENEQLYGWLIYDFRRSNPLAVTVLGISDQAHLTRRYFYWIPQKGDPIKLVRIGKTMGSTHLSHGKGGETPLFSWRVFKLFYDYSPGFSAFEQNLSINWLISGKRKQQVSLQVSDRLNF